MHSELWNVNRRIYECFDAESGEIFDLEKLASLEMQREEIIENLGLLWKQTNVEIAGIDSEMDRLKAIKESRNKLKAQIENWISDATGGEAYKSANGLWESKITKSKATEVVDMDALLKWDLSGRFTKAEYKPIKAEIKKAITKEGITVPGCAVIDKINFSIK